MIPLRKYLPETVAIVLLLVFLNVIQLLLTDFVLVGEFSLQRFTAALANQDWLRVFALHILFGAIFGLIISIIFARYQTVKLQGADRDRAAKEELERALRDLSKLDALKSKFIKVVSHQIRTPITSISWNLEELLGGDLGKLRKNQEQFLRLAYKSNRFIISVIDDLLVAMDVEEGRFRVVRLPVRIDEIVRSVIKEHENEMRVKNIKSALTVPGGVPPEIDADAQKIHQAIGKVVDNAVRYTGEHGSIDVSIAFGASDVTISVRDNGIGIPASEQQHIFEKFFRASNAAETHPDASGLGLYITKSIVTAHGGKILLKSDVGKGTEITITLPAVGVTTS